MYEYQYVSDVHVLNVGLSLSDPRPSKYMSLCLLRMWGTINSFILLISTLHPYCTPQTSHL